MTIHGKVSDCATGEPIRDASLETDTGIYVFTESDGSYSMDLLMGFYYMAIDAPGYLGRTFDLLVDPLVGPENDFCLFSEASLGFIYGFVTNSETGAPLLGAQVSVWNYEFSTTTNFDGYYLLESPPGDLEFVVEAQGYVTKAQTFTLSTGELLPLDIELSPVGGVVDDHCNTPDPCATTIYVNAEPLQGSIEVAGDVDWFGFRGLNGATYEIETSQLGPGSDTVIDLYREDGTSLIGSNDDYGYGLASKIVWTADETALFYVKVRHFSLSGTGTYRISVKGSDDHCNTPDDCATQIQSNGNPIPGTIETGGDRDWFRFTAVPGLTYELETFDLGPGSDTVISLYRSDGTTLVAENDDSGATLASKITWVADSQDTFYIMVRHYNQMRTGSYKIRLMGFDDHCDSRMSCATHLIPNGTLVQGSFEKDQDKDLFKFQAIFGVTYEIKTSNLSPECDTIIYLFSSDGDPIDNDDDGGDELWASRIIWTADSSGTFYVLVKHWSESGRGTYNLSVTGSDDHADTVMNWATWLVTNGEPISGNIEVGGDRDLFRFSAEAERTYTIETGNLGGGCNTVIYLYDPDGNFIISNDDIVPGNLASRITYTVADPGTYYVQVRHYDQSTGTGTYEISVLREDDHANSATGATLLQTGGVPVPVPGEFESEGDEDWFRFDAVADQRYVIETGNLADGCDTFMALYAPDGTLLSFDDDGGYGLASQIAWTAPSSDTFYIRLTHFSPYGTGSYQIWIRTLVPGSDDHADTSSEATPVTTDGTVNPGLIDFAGDVDWFQFEAEAGVEYIIETSNLAQQCDTVIEIYGPDGTTLIFTDDDSGAGLSSRIVWLASAAGTYYVRVYHFSSRGTGGYDLSIQLMPTCTTINPDEWVDGSLTGTGAGDLYCLDLNEGDQVTVSLNGPQSGSDFDLYLRLGVPPTLADYDVRGFTNTSQEICELTASSSGKLYIWVRSYSGLGDYAIEATVVPYSPPSCDLTLTEDQPQIGTLDGPGDAELYCLAVAEGDQVLIMLNGPNTGADFDLYLKFGSPPTSSDYDARGYTPFSDEMAALSNLAGGWLYVWVVSYSGGGEYSLEAQITPTRTDCVQLTEGVPWHDTDTIYSTYDEKLYCFDINAAEEITVTLNGPQSGEDFDLYLKFGSPPTLDDYDMASTSSASQEQISGFTSPSAGPLYIMVWSYLGSGEYNIQVTLQVNQQMSELITKSSQTPSDTLFVKGRIVDKLTSQGIQPNTFCITIKDVDKLCYNSAPNVTSQISFVPGGYFLFEIPRANNVFTCTITDIPCYGVSEKDFSEEQMSNAIFEVEMNPDSDCDQDGMKTGWEKQYGLNIWKNDALLDKDGDNYTNLAEFNAGSNPNDANSIPLGLKFIERGDINGDGTVDLLDAIIALRVQAGMDTSKLVRSSYPTSDADVNGDGRIGMEEIIYILQYTAQLRP